MSPSAEEIRKQIELLNSQLKEQEEKERIEKEEQEKLNPLIVKIDSFNQTRKVLAIQANKFREDYVEIMRSIPSRRWLQYVKMDEISVEDWDRFWNKLISITNFKWEETEAEKAFYTWRNQPDVKVDFVDSKFLIYLKEMEKFRYNIFGNTLNPIVKYHTTERYFSLPYNEGGKLLNRLNDIKDIFKVEWEPLAIEAAEQELNDRNKINDLAKLDYNPDYDIDLNGNRLFKFQTVGVGFADHSLFNVGNNGVMIDDEMGLGKSPQSLAVAVKRNLRTLILTPAAGRDNWFDYVEKFTGQKAKLFQKTEPDRFDFEAMLVNKSQWNIMAYDTIARGADLGPDPDNNSERLVKYLWADLINLSQFDLIICDECHKLKNEEAGRTKAFMLLKPKKFICLSGTPILNRPAEFAPVLSKVDPKNFADTKMFVWRYADGKNGAKNVHELRELLRPVMIRRKKSEVLPDLPPVIPMTEHYIMNEKEQYLYDSVLNQVLDSIDDSEFEGATKNFNFFASNFLVKILRLKQVCALMVADKVAEFAFEAYHNSESDHKKVIIFSQFIPVVHRIKQLLGNEALHITGEDHSPSDRLRIVKEFNTDPHFKYLVASTKAASEQLNITSAGTVIFNDLMWTNADHEQAIGRAYGRLNDCHGVDAHYWVVKGTIMEWILKILAEKKETFDAIVEGVEADRVNNNSVIADLIEMLKGLKKNRRK